VKAIEKETTLTKETEVLTSLYFAAARNHYEEVKSLLNIIKENNFDINKVIPIKDGNGKIVAHNPAFFGIAALDTVDYVKKTVNKKSVDGILTEVVAEVVDFEHLKADEKKYIANKAKIANCFREMKGLNTDLVILLNKQDLSYIGFSDHKGVDNDNVQQDFNKELVKFKCLYEGSLSNASYEAMKEIAANILQVTDYSKTPSQKQRRAIPIYPYTEARLKSLSKLANDLTDIDFRGVDLNGFNLEGCNFDNCNLHGAQFEGSILTKSSFVNATLTKTNFNNATLQEVNFTSANLDESQIVNADLRGSNFTGSTFNNADVHAIKVDGTKGLNLIGVFNLLSHVIVGDKVISIAKHVEKYNKKKAREDTRRDIADKLKSPFGVRGGEPKAMKSAPRSPNSGTYRKKERFLPKEHIPQPITPKPTKKVRDFDPFEYGEPGDPWALPKWARPSTPISGTSSIYSRIPDDDLSDYAFADKYGIQILFGCNFKSLHEYCRENRDDIFGHNEISEFGLFPKYLTIEEIRKKGIPKYIANSLVTQGLNSTKIVNGYVTYLKGPKLSLNGSAKKVDVSKERAKAEERKERQDRMQALRDRKQNAPIKPPFHWKTKFDVESSSSDKLKPEPITNSIGVNALRARLISEEVIEELINEKLNNKEFVDGYLNYLSEKNPNPVRLERNPTWHPNAVWNPIDPSLDTDYWREDCDLGALSNYRDAIVKDEKQHSPKKVEVQKQDLVDNCNTNKHPSVESYISFAVEQTDVVPLPDCNLHSWQDYIKDYKKSERVALSPQNTLDISQMMEKGISKNLAIIIKKCALNKEDIVDGYVSYLNKLSLKDPHESRSGSTPSESSSDEVGQRLSSSTDKNISAHEMRQKLISEEVINYLCENNFNKEWFVLGYLNYLNKKNDAFDNLRRYSIHLSNGRFNTNSYARDTIYYRSDCKLEALHSYIIYISISKTTDINGDGKGAVDTEDKTGAPQSPIDKKPLRPTLLCLNKNGFTLSGDGIKGETDAPESPRENPSSVGASLTSEEWRRRRERMHARRLTWGIESGEITGSLVDNEGKMTPPQSPIQKRLTRDEAAKVNPVPTRAQFGRSQTGTVPVSGSASPKSLMVSESGNSSEAEEKAAPGTDSKSKAIRFIREKRIAERAAKEQELKNSAEQNQQGKISFRRNSSSSEERSPQ
jgi:uncharacterized protein YjbI with pentapeptide repeats